MSDEELIKAIYEAMPYLSERHDAIKKLIKQYREVYEIEANDTIKLVCLNCNHMCTVQLREKVGQDDTK